MYSKSLHSVIIKKYDKSRITRLINVNISILVSKFLIIFCRPTQ